VGVVAYDSRDGPVKRGPGFDEAVTLLALFVDHCEPKA